MPSAVSHNLVEPLPVRYASRQAPVLLLAASAALGVVSDRLLSDTAGWRLGCMAWWALASVLLAGWYRLHRTQRTMASCLFLMASIACLAGGWHLWSWNLFAENDVGRLATQQPYPCCIEAVAVAAPERVAAPPTSAFRAIPQSEKSQLLLQVTSVRNGEHWRSAVGNCQLIVDGHLLGVHAHDRLRVFGQFRQPSPAMNPGQFDYAKHLRADRELCYMRCRSPDCVETLSRGSAWLPSVWGDQLRSRWQSRLWAALGPDLAPTAAAMLLGARHSMPRESVDAYRVTGALHVLVVSGLHAGILISGVATLLGLGWLPKRWGLLLAMLLVAGYAWITGGHPPVLRAAILAELACIALWLDRNPFAFNSLAVAALVVLALNPADLFRTGPQLSFLYVAVLLWFSSVRWRRQPSPLAILLHKSRPWYQRAASRVGERVAWTMAATFAVWVLSLPLLVERYNLVTPMAVVACVPLFLCVSCSLISGFAFLVLGWLAPPLEPILARACSVSVASLNHLVEKSAEIQAGYQWTPAPDGWWVLGWYLLVAGLLCAGGTRFGWRRTVMAASVWVIVGAAPALLNRVSSKPLEVAFLDVGHGVCAVVTTSDGATLLYDAGSLGSPSYATDTIANYLWSRGIRTIDGVVLSHADVDHFNAVPGLLDRFKVGRVFVTPHMFAPGHDPTDQSAPAELQRLLLARGIPIEIVELGDRLTIDRGVHADVLYPDRLGSFGSDNANSMVLALVSGEHRVLLPGDIEEPGIDDVMADPIESCTVLLAPHHGSRRSDPPGFANWSRPEYVVVSGGDRAVDRTVEQSYEALGAQMWATSEYGAISFEFSSADVRVVRYRPPK